MKPGDVDLDLLDLDLATCGDTKKFLRSYLKDSAMEIPADSILQLKCMLNMSVPELDRQLPRKYLPGVHTLKVMLTDGDLNICAHMDRPYSGFGLNTPPGTKIRLTEAVTIINGTFSLSANNFEVLGGYVPHLIQNWILQRKMNMGKHWGWPNVTHEGPEWSKIPFGIDVLRAKAMDIINKKREQSEQENRRKNNFGIQRELNFKRPTDKQVNQKWKKMTKNPIDEEISGLLKDGLSLEEAVLAADKIRNRKLVARQFKSFGIGGKIKLEQPLKKLANEKEKDEDDEEALEYQRPTEDITLFSFIEPHIQLEVASTPDLSNHDQNCNQPILNVVSDESVLQVENSPQFENEEKYFQIVAEAYQFETDRSVQSPMLAIVEDTALDNSEFSERWNFDEYLRNQKLSAFRNDHLSGSNYYENNSNYNVFVKSKYRRSTASRNTDIWQRPNYNVTEEAPSDHDYRMENILASPASSFNKSPRYPNWKVDGDRNRDVQPYMQNWQKEMLKNPLLGLGLSHSRKGQNQNRSFFPDFKKTEKKKALEIKKMNYRKYSSGGGNWKSERENNLYYEQAWNENIGFSQYHSPGSSANRMQKIRQGFANSTNYRDRNKSNRYDETPKRGRSGFSYRKDMYQYEYNGHYENKRQGRQINTRKFEGVNRNASENENTDLMFLKTLTLESITEYSSFHSPSPTNKIDQIETPDDNQGSWMPFNCNLFDMSSIIKSERRQEAFNSSGSTDSQSQQSSPSPKKEYQIYQ